MQSELALFVGFKIITEHVDPPQEFTEKFILICLDRHAQISTGQLDGKIAHLVEGAQDLLIHIDQDDHSKYEAGEHTQIHVKKRADIRFDLIFKTDDLSENFPHLVIVIDHFIGLEQGYADQRWVFFYIKIPG